MSISPAPFVYLPHWRRRQNAPDRPSTRPTPRLKPTQPQPVSSRAYPPLCEPDSWRLQAVHGTIHAYLVTLRCTSGHLHHAELVPTYLQARALMRRWVVETFGPQHPGFMLEDMESRLLILPDGRQWPLRPDTE